MLDQDIELEPKLVEKLLRCDLCNKLKCTCEILNETKKLGIGFKYGKRKRK